MKTSRNLRNQHGISLVEVLAVIVILSIVSVLLFGIISSGQKQYSDQSKKNQELQEISYKFKVLTKDIRKAKEVKFESGSSYSIDVIYDSTNTNTYRFDELSKILYKDEEPFLYNVAIFNLNPDVSDASKVSALEIEIDSKKPVSTKIIVRSGD